MKRAILPILLLLVIPLVPITSYALTVKIFLCGDSTCSSLTQLDNNTLTGTSQVNIAGTYGNLTILNLSSSAIANAAISQSASVKNVKLSNALIRSTVAGTYLIRMLSDAGYNPQPGNRNYTNSVTINGFWVGSGDFRGNTIKEVLYANVGNPNYQTSVDRSPGTPTVTVQYASATQFSRLQNTVSEDIYLPFGIFTCTDPSTGGTLTNCGKNSHQKDLMIRFGAPPPSGSPTPPMPQTVNMGESSIGVTSENEVSRGGRAEVNKFLLCGQTTSQFQAGTTGVEKNYVVFPHSPLAIEPNPPHSKPRNLPIQFDATLAPLGGTDTLVSIWSDADASNNSQFNLFLPCQPIKFGDISNLTAVFPTNAFTINGETSSAGACKGTLRWVLDLVDNQSNKEVVQVVYGDVTSGFDSCQSFSGTNMMATGDARFLVDGQLYTRKQLNSFNNKFFVTSIKLFLDGSLAMGFPANQSAPIDIKVTLTSMQVNSDAPITFSTQLQVAVCPPPGPYHGFEILITSPSTSNFPSGFSNLIPQSRISTTGCKISVGADSATDFGGDGAYTVYVLNNHTLLDHGGFITLGD